MAKNYQVGAEIEALCTKCELDRSHTIESLKSDGNINRVVCGKCQSSHRFRRPLSAGAAKKSSRSAAQKGAVTLTESEIAKAKPYAMDGKFKMGDVIQHAKFGPGSVVSVKANGTMEVGFETGAKTLVCRRLN